MEYDLQTQAGAESRFFEDDDFPFLTSSLATGSSIIWPRRTFEILQGDARKLIPQLPQVHCVVCSPPYYQQRKYGANPDEEIGRCNDVDDYIDSLVDVFGAINLHPAGSIWVNISDKRGKTGDLLCIPERFVVAMAYAGFRLVDRVTWAKSEAYEDGTTNGNYAPEPCKGRLNDKAQEPVYRFTRSSNAWADTLAVQLHRQNVGSVRYLPEDLMTVDSSLNGRNLHTVWNVRPGQTSQKHFAVYPPAICERPVAMTCPPFVNPDGSLPRRLVEMVQYDEGKGKRSIGRSDPMLSAEETGRQDSGRRYVPRMPVSRGWEPILEGATAGVVFDPFVGTGTTGEVALKLGRSFLGTDLYGDYVQMARKRCANAMRYVDSNYGYNLVYEMITLDQSELNAKVGGIDSGSVDSALHPHLAPLFENQGGNPTHLR